MKFLALGLTALLLAVGCGGGSSNQVGGDIPGINVQVTSPAGPAAVEAGLVLPISVTVTNDPANAGVIWTVAPQHRGDPSGTLSDVKPESVTYNPPAPAQVNAPVQVTVTATSVTDPTRAAAIAISVYPALAITTQSSDLSTAFLNTNYSCIQAFKRSQTVVQIQCEINAIGGLGPYTWSLANSLLPDGLLLTSGVPHPPATATTLVVGKPTTAGIYPFTITVADSLGGTSSAPLNINVAPAQLKVVTPTIVSTVPNVPYSPVALQVSGGVPPYTWSLAPGLDPAIDLPPGMQLSQNGVLSGTPTTSNSFSIALRVRDSQSPVPAEAIFPLPKPAGQDTNNNIQLATTVPRPCEATGAKLLAGAHYALMFTGFDADGPVTYSGSLTADTNGNLTGVEDIIRKSGAQLNQPLTGGSLIQFNPVEHGCMTLSTASGSSEFRLFISAFDSVTGAVTEARMIQFDDASGTGTRGSGFLRMQDDTAFSTSPEGSYALRLYGWDASGNHFALAGTATAGSGSFTSVSADVNAGGAFSGPLNGGSGTFTSVDANGRGTATIGVGTATYDLIFYVVDANRLVINSTQAAGSGHPLITGEATTSAGPFPLASLSNSHIYRISGHIPGSPDVGIGVLHFDGAGAFSGTAYARSGGSATATTLSGQYSSDPNTGRVAFSGTSIPAVGYLTGDSNGLTAYLVGTGSSATSGVMEFQTNSYPPGYQFGPISQIYSVLTEEMLDRQTTVLVGRESLNSDGNVVRFDDGSSLDLNRPTALIASQQFSNFRYTWSPEGSGTFGGNTYMVTNSEKFFYIDISPFEGHPSVVVGKKHQ